MRLTCSFNLRGSIMLYENRMGDEGKPPPVKDGVA